MRRLLPKRKLINPKELLRQVEDTDSTEEFITSKTYLSVCSKAHKTMKGMTIEDKKHKGISFLSGVKLKGNHSLKPTKSK